MTNIHKTEIFRIDRAKYMLDNYDNFKDHINLFKHDSNDSFIQLSNYIKRAETENGVIGKINVSYHQTNPNGGRYFADKAMSLQGITRAIRHTISEGIYVDIDMKNAHPVILQHLYKSANKDHMCPHLDNYIENRQQRMGEIANSNAPDKYKNDPKRYYLILTNSGDDDSDGYESWYTEHSKNYRTEMRKKIHLYFANSNPKQYSDFCKYRTEKRGKTHNMQGAYMNILLCDFENKILQILLKFYGNNDNSVLCHDGLMIPKKEGEQIRELYDLDGAEDIVKKELGISIRLEIKPFNNGINPIINGDVKIDPYIPEEFKYYTDNIKFTGNENENTLQFMNNWANNCISFITASALNGGDVEMLIRKNVEYTQLAGFKQELEYYSIAPAKKSILCIDRICKIINPNFNQAFYEQNSSYAESNKIWNDTRMNRYLFKCKLSEYVKYLQENVKVPFYTSIEFTPYLHANTACKNAFNIFRGFPHYKKIPDKTINIEESNIYKMLAVDFCNNDLSELSHLLDTLADKVQNPAHARRNGHIFIGPEGTGKGAFAKLLANVFGHHNVAIIGDVARYFDKFNALTANKLIKIFEENGEDGAAFKFSELLKAQMTEATEKTERKGKEISETTNCAAIFAFSNHYDNIVKMDGAASRYTVHHISGSRANDLEYFSLIWDEVNNPEFCISMFHFLVNRKYDVKNANRCYDNDAKKSHKHSQLKSGYKFIIEKMQECFRGVDISYLASNNSIFRFPVADLNTEFKELNYMARGETLSKQLSHIGITISTYSDYRGGNGKYAKCFILHPLDVEKRIGEYLKEPDFRIDYNIINDAAAKEAALTVEYIDKKILEHETEIKKLLDIRNKMINEK